MTVRGLCLGQGNAFLALVFTAPVKVGGFADLVRFEKQHLRHAFIGIDLCRQRCGIGKFKRHVPFPLRLQWCHVNDDATTGIGGFAQANRQYRARDPEIFNRVSERKRVRRNDTDIAGEVDEAVLGEILRIDDRGIDIGEYLEMVGAAHVIAVT